MTNPPPYPGMSASQPYAGPPPVAGKRSTVRTVLIVVGVLLALCVFGGVVAAAIGDSDNTPTRPLTAQDQGNRDAAAVPTSPSTSSPAATATTSPAAKPTKAKPEPVRIGEGSYRVGEDIPAGRYKAVERADADCYWSREKGTSIIDNNIGGGFPQFTTRKGEDVTIGFACPEFELRK